MCRLSLSGNGAPTCSNGVVTEAGAVALSPWFGQAVGVDVR